MKDPILIVLHTGSNTGYAIAPLERVFLGMARALVGDDSLIHFAYRGLERGRPATLPEDFENVAALNLEDAAPEAVAAAAAYVGRHGIRTVFAFDAPITLPTYRPMRRAGVTRIISYQGAPMSSLNSGLRLLLKKLEVQLHTSRPDHYIFESEAMRATAIRGRGIPAAQTTVVYLGVDLDRFAPTGDMYAHREFDIPEDRLLVVYSGHMEQRKGVHVLLSAFVELTEQRQRRDLHLLILGNQPGQMEEFLPIFEGTAAERHITFGGYRDDVPAIFGSADVGAIASTGWDSFTMSSVEMAAAGLPLVVSDLQGLAETVEPGVTGFTFPPGDAAALASLLERLAEDPEMQRRMGSAARERALARHSVAKQVADLSDIVRTVAEG